MKNRLDLFICFLFARMSVTHLFSLQILQAKVRRLEHLLHLKDIRIDDLQTRMDRLESQLRPTGVGKATKK